MAADQRFRVFRRGVNTRAVILRLSLADYAELEVLADEADIGVATVIKQLIRQALSRGVVVVEQQPPPVIAEHDVVPRSEPEQPEPEPIT